MKIATFNIDWAKKYSAKKHYLKIENFLNEQHFDFLILTESIPLNLSNFKFRHFSTAIPENSIYEKLNYSDYLNGEKAYRTSIYSNIAPKKQFLVCDDKTSVALEFETIFGPIVIYATIIGTRYKEQPFAENELQNCIIDCENIAKENKNIFIVGDLNTSFIKSEANYTINKSTTERLENLFKKHQLIIATKQLPQNIDHIIIPSHLDFERIDAKVFIEKNKLSDHKGIAVHLISK